MKNDVLYDCSKVPTGIKFAGASQEGRVVSFSWIDGEVRKKAAFYRHSDGTWGASPEFLAEAPEVRRYLYGKVLAWQDSCRKGSKKKPRKKKKYQRREVLFF